MTDEELNRIIEEDAHKRIVAQYGKKVKEDDDEEEALEHEAEEYQY